MADFKTEIKNAILSTLVVSNPESFEYAWKKIEPLILDKLAEQRAMCADAFWNNHFQFWDKIPSKAISEMMKYIEHYDSPNLSNRITERTRE